MIASAQTGTFVGGLKEAARAYLVAVGLQDDLQAAAPTPMAAQKKLDNLEGFLKSLERFEQREARDLGAFLHRISLDTKDDDEGADAADKVTLVTLHGSKGLEFPVVFLVGVEEDLLPCAGIQGEARDLEEERRLAYVGITRARELLYVTRAETRTKRGKILARTPSRFLEDLPANAHEKLDPTAFSSKPQDVAAHTEDVMATLRARLGGG
jgi:DNA helicase II / ATP-dependent DNA helicase PcrA